MSLLKTSKINSVILLMIGIFLTMSCNNTSQDYELKTDTSGNAVLAGNDTSMISKIGPMAPNVLEHIQNPQDGVTRLIVKSIRASADPVYNVFDINYNGTLEIKGNGYYKLSKDENSNVWRLEISGDTIESFSIHEGIAPGRFAGVGNLLIIIGVILIVVSIFSLAATFGTFGWSIFLGGVIVIFIGAAIKGI